MDFFSQENPICLGKIQQIKAMPFCAEEPFCLKGQANYFTFSSAHHWLSKLILSIKKKKSQLK